MDSITEQLAQLQELSDEQLAELENSAVTEFDDVSKQDLTPQNVDSMEQLANAVEAVRAEKARRQAEMEQLTQKAAEAAARVNPPDLEDPEDVADGGADEDSEGDGTGAPDEQPEDMPADAPPASPNDPAVEPNPGEGDDSKLKKPGSYSNETEKAAELSNAPTEEAPAATTASAETPEPAPTAPAAAAAEASAATEPETPPAAPPAAAEASTETPVAAEAATEEQPEAEDDKSDEAASSTETASTDAPAEAEASTETPAEAEASDNTPDTTTPEAPVTAAAQGNGSTQAEPPADRKPVLKPAAATMTITAGADIPGITAGTTFNDMHGVAEAFTKRLHSLRHVNGGDGEQHIVASLQFEYPEDRILDANDPASNTDKVFKVTGPAALTAAAGICLPLETRYDLGCEVGVTDRPVRDALARFAADRGGIRYFSSPLLTDEANATGFWRGDSNGANWHTYGPDRTSATSPADQKPCLEVQCTQENTAYIEAITLCLTFNNLTTRTFPELVQRHNELALVAHARIAENALLAQLEAGSTAITAQQQVVGAAREIFNLLGRAVASYRFKHRMNSVSPLRMVAPMWVMDLLRADIALQMPGDGLNDTLGLAESMINTWFSARGVNITWHLDGVGPATADLDGAGTGTAVGFEWPSTIEFGLWAEGTWLYLDGGTLDLGVIRDSGLVATNQYKQFVETFEGVANMGCDSYWVTAAYEPTGQAASLVDTLP